MKAKRPNSHFCEKWLRSSFASNAKSAYYTVVNSQLLDRPLWVTAFQSWLSRVCLLEILRENLILTSFPQPRPNYLSCLSAKSLSVAARENVIANQIGYVYTVRPGYSDAHIPPSHFVARRISLYLRRACIQNNHCCLREYIVTKKILLYGISLQRGLTVCQCWRSRTKYFLNIKIMSTWGSASCTEVMHVEVDRLSHSRHSAVIGVNHSLSSLPQGSARTKKKAILSQARLGS